LGRDPRVCSETRRTKTSGRVPSKKLQSVLTLCGVVVVLVAQTKSETDSQTDNDDDEESNEQAPPLQLASVTSTLDALIKLNITSFGVLLNVLGMLLGLLNHGLLNNDGLGEILEELVELDQSTLNLLNVVVASAHSTKNGAGSGRAVGLELETKLAHVIDDAQEMNIQQSGKHPRCPNRRWRPPGLRHR